MFCIKLIPLFFVLFIHIVQNNVNAELQAEGIRGGDKAKKGEISYQISIQVGRAHICGGSIISDRHILTAAHCVLDDEGKFEEVQMSVVAGVNYTRATGIRVPIEKIYVPKEYNPRRPGSRTPYRPTGDIAVLKLKEDLGVESFNLTKLSLPKSIKSNTPTPSYSSYENRTAVVSGFGFNWVEVEIDPKNNRTFENTGGSDHYLRYAETKVLNSAKCAKHYVNPIHDSNLCAQVKQRDPKTIEAVCSLDSGGPLVYKKNTIIGVLNNSPVGCDETVVSAVYARVTSFLPFIQNAMEDNKTDDIRVGTWTIKDEEKVLLVED